REGRAVNEKCPDVEGTSWLARGHRPGAEEPRAAGDQLLAVRREEDTGGVGGGRAAQLRQGLAGRGVPELRSVVLAGGPRLAVRGERERINRLLVGADLADMFAGRGVPEMQRADGLREIARQVRRRQ